MKKTVVITALAIIAALALCLVGCSSVSDELLGDSGSFKRQDQLLELLKYSGVDSPSSGAFAIDGEYAYRLETEDCQNLIISKQEKAEMPQVASGYVWVTTDSITCPCEIVRNNNLKIGDVSYHYVVKGVTNDKGGIIGAEIYFSVPPVGNNNEFHMTFSEIERDSDIYNLLAE